MSFNSILLILDGSAQCVLASELVFQVCRDRKIALNAQYVVDSLGIWEFLNYDLPGLIGSGPYLNAHEAMRRELFSLGQTLTEMYEVRAESAAVVSGIFLDEGNPVREICQRAKDHDLVVVGHKPTGISSATVDRRRVPRYSLVELLAMSIEKPLLIVQERSPVWSTLDVYVDTSREFQNTLNGSFALASMLSANIQVTSCISEQEEFNRPDILYECLDSLRSEYKQVSVQVVCTDARSVKREMESKVNYDSLVVMSSLDNGNNRVDPVGLTVDQIIRYLSVSSLLIWPEHSTFRRSEARLAAVTENE